MASGTLNPVRPPKAAPPADGGPADAELVRRFAGGRDDAAFAALVRRHGPMVLGVCRRVLRRPHDAEEAFQATFLALVRKAGTLARPDQLASWLYGAAYRAALKVRSTAARQAALVKAAAERPAPAGDDGPWADLRAALDEEVVGLPEKYRSAIVLCYLEGMTNEAAARQLGWPAGSVSSRLARGRELLRERLQRRTRRFLAPLPFALWLSGQASAAAVPPDLAARTAPPKPAGGPRWRAWGLPVGAAAVLLLLLLAAGFGTAAPDPGAAPGDARPAAVGARLPGGSVTRGDSTLPAAKLCAKCVDGPKAVPAEK